ncbi:bifunctional ADP-dependent NAD(P)H-hydrate dehydratase/NAD(P)H-hydrate epimerase [Granulicella tundricola]|uniref:Bifunctional NAD(P)H-hydrate repair enzyme n=1 Tax=Granulicella tundricola (strain ATCC BAA-1859 / DSM 23138 / MP5ACTX9) TaxID=1198114 RepID=E8WXW2_GRATM|nr:bifunctional ADP-dependent NAD(P)H-hydrate dehydratase/NAD(P)H-hydrate epimerase [Granulicella tundricola]ADW69807.1 carbohydrate kinase, YjeF related protein [Granulicella tundricola MP5ACTX9]
MKILTAAEMKQADDSSVAAGIPIADLMEAAGEAVAAFCLRQYPQAAHVMVLCGKGNNGGDGFVAARLLAGEGVGVRVLLAGRQDDVKGDAAEALALLKEATSDEIVEEFVDETDEHLEAIIELLSEADLILDAVVGTGFKPPLRGPAAILRDALAKSAIPVVAVDLPSGWDADSQQQTAEGAFRADAVVTFTAPKHAHIFGHLTAATFGPVVVADIGSPEDTIQSSQNLNWAGTAKSVTERPRDINSNKGKFGHILIIGGSFGTAGAPSMASLAALRAGAGLVTAAVPREIVNLVGSVTPELMVRPLLHDAEGTATAANLTNLETLTKGIKVIAIGPGLSTQGEASEFARGVVAQTKLPIVIDADALNAFDADHVHLLDGANRTMVLTPHPGEMARLLGKTVKEVEADRINLARKFATEHHLTLVLKGWRTLIAHPDGSIAVNTTGNPGLAKGGSGDILTGIVAALLGQYPDNVAEAVEAAVYLHGLAADLVARHLDEKSILATDVISHLTQAFRYRNVDADGLTWFCGIQPKPKEPADA